MLEILLSFLCGALVCFLTLAYFYANNVDFVKWWNNFTKRSLNETFKKWIDSIKHKIDKDDGDQNE